MEDDANNNTNATTEEVAADTAHFFAAGVTPVCMYNGKRRFLLANEKHGRERYRFCDYGGCRKRGETEVQTAAREYIEETRGIFWDYHEMGRLIHLLETTATRADVACRRRTANNYVHYLLPVRYRPQSVIQSRFNARAPRNKVENEKLMFRWFTEDELFGAVFSHGIVSPGLKIRSTYLFSITYFPSFDEFVRQMPYAECPRVPHGALSRNHQ
jgi:hypothetical protein